MSFDDGVGNEMSSESDFRAKFAAAVQESGKSFQAVCDYAGVDRHEAVRVIEAGTYGLPASIPILQRLLNVMNLDIAYLLDGQSIGHRSLMERRRELRTLVWDFLLRNSGVPREHRQPLINTVLATLEDRPRNSVTGLAARHPVPRTIMDVAYIYKSLRGSF